MEISYGKDADALYIKFREGKFDSSSKVDDFTVLDKDKEGNVLGIEILEASKRLPLDALSDIKVKNLPIA